MADKFDLCVIGSGPGGYVAAIRAAQLGLKTVVVEKAELGGICLNWGCIPTKALVHSATVVNHIKHAADFGISVSGMNIEFDKVIKHSRTVAGRLSKGIEFLFRKNKIETIFGHGKLISAGKVEVQVEDGGTKTIEAKHILLATGARARSIPGVEFDGKRIISSREAMVLDKVPEKMIIIGAGAIGVEFAYFYTSMGSKVTLIEMLPHILPLEDAEVVQVAERAFKKMGMEILTATKVETLEKTKSGVRVKTSSAKGTLDLEGDLALVAVGVQGNIENIGLETVGVKTEKSFIPVDKKTFRTNIPGIYDRPAVAGARGIGRRHRCCRSHDRPQSRAGGL